MKFPRLGGLRLPRIRWRTVLIHAAAWSIGLIWLIPFLGVLMASIRPFDEILYGWWNPAPFNPNIANFVAAWDHEDYPIGGAMRNSFLVAIPATFIPLFVAAVAAYGFARFHFRTRDYIFLSIVMLMAVPQQMVVLPIFSKMVELGLYDNHLSLILVHSAWGIPWILLFLRNFFHTLPVEVEEAARVDGASDLRIFFKIVLPMSIPALAAVAVFQFLWVWNDFFFAAVLTSPFGDQALATQQIPRLGLRQFGSDFGLLSAAVILVLSVPVLIFILLQRYYIRGMIGWTIKG